MKLSARNMLKGKIVEVKKGQTTAHVRIDIGGSIVTSSITNEAVDELKLVAGPDRLCRRQGLRCHDRDRLTSIRPSRFEFAEGLPLSGSSVEPADLTSRYIPLNISIWIFPV